MDETFHLQFVFGKLVRQGRLGVNSHYCESQTYLIERGGGAVCRRGAKKNHEDSIP